jgi:hypothetical protein
MRILNRKQFLAEPIGTVFFDYIKSTSTGPMSVRTDAPGYLDNDFCRMTIDISWNVAKADAICSCSSSDEMSDLLAAAEDGEQISLHFDADSRDGMFEAGAMFAVLDDDDVERLIKLLQTRKDMK